MNPHRFRSLFFMTLGACAVCLGQGVDGIDATIGAPEFDARVSIGFNYDFLRPPTKVSFDYPVGYIGLNIPLSYGIDKSLTESITRNVTKLFAEGEKFEPTASAQQAANSTIRVDVPIWGGVASFANIQNFYFKYGNTLGEPNISTGFGNDTISFLLRGMISVPLDLSMGWETMTFGYAYKLNEKLKFALNLHRHIFKLDLRAKIDIDLLGYFDVNLPEISIEQKPINYSSNDVYGEAYGHYSVEAWSPTFGVKFWRAGLTSRFGIHTQATGSLYAVYSLPFFIDPETFAMDDVQDQAFLMENVDRFLNSETDSIRYESTEKLRWKMPHGHSLTFDIIPDRLYLSYTKIFGDIEMELKNIRTIRKQSNDEASDSTEPKSVDFSVGVSVDHIIMLHGAFQNAFFNLGVCSMDFRFADKANLLSTAVPDLKFGNGILIPALNFGTTMGSKLKLLLEVDLLPLSALKTGLVYHF